MVVVELKCQMCGNCFEAEILDREDWQEREVHGDPVRCPKCKSSRVETMRRVRRGRSTSARFGR